MSTQTDVVVMHMLDLAVGKKSMVDLRNDRNPQSVPAIVFDNPVQGGCTGVPVHQTHGQDDLQ